MRPSDFILKLLPAAQACERASGIPTSFTLAQAALESAWGTSTLFNRGMNIFGVKADKSWHGPTQVILTKEFRAGKMVKEPALWRVYSSYEECLLNRVTFFRTNPRYDKCWDETTGEGWAKAVAKAGYATDPDYAKKLIAIMRGRNMSQYDVNKGDV